LRVSREGIRTKDDDGTFGRVEWIHPDVVDGRGDGVVEQLGVLESPPSLSLDTTSFLAKSYLHGRVEPAENTIAGYFTLPSFDNELKELLRVLESYLELSHRKRPFNVLLVAKPGSGKSYFAERLSAELSRRSEKKGRGRDQHPFVERNLALAEGAGGIDAYLTDIYEEIRDCRAVGKIPVVLLDEFDTYLKRDSEDCGTSEVKITMQSLFARMLVPLWDGNFMTGGRIRRMGGFVLILAVSDSEFVKSFEAGKGKDFATRIHVRLDIPELVAGSDEGIELQARIALGMIRKHHGDTVSRVQLAVLDAIGRATFKGSNRGIDKLIMLSAPPSGGGVFATTNLPSGSFLGDNLVENMNCVQSKARFGDAWISMDTGERTR